MAEKSGNPDVIAGKNAVAEALRAGRRIDCVLIAHGAFGKAAGIAEMCRERGVPVKEASPRRLDEISGGTAHGGIAALAAQIDYASIDEMLALAESRGEKPLLVICDSIEDPGNLGAVIRTAEAAGAHGVIIPKRGGVSVTPAVVKAASGAAEYVPVSRVANISDAILRLKEKGVWVFAADMDGEPWCGADLTVPLALVLGSEGRGIGRLVKSRCDRVLALPMRGRINSLNVSVAAGILMYEAVRQRRDAGR